MANKIIKYNLTSSGTIPTFIVDGGYFAKTNSNASPRDWDFIGVTSNGSSEEGLGVLANQAAVKTYLDTYTSDWTIPDPDDIGGNAFATVAFNQTAAAAVILAKKIN